MILAPETCSIEPSQATSVFSRVKIPPTQSQQETINLLETDSLAETSQVSKVSSKRARSSTDMDGMTPRPSRQRLEAEDTPAFLSQSPASISQTPSVPSQMPVVPNQSTVVPTQSQSMRFSTASSSSQASERVEKENRRQPPVQENDEDDLFGFGSIRSRKRSQPLQHSVESQPSSKRVKPDDDDIFGFNKIKKEPSFEDLQTLDSQVSSGTSQTVGEKSIIDENKNLEKSVEGSVRKVSEVKFDSTGFIGRDDVKLEVKRESSSEDGNVDDITNNVSKITLVRAKKSKSSYVAAEAPSLLGKPVKNFKKFRKQTLNTSVRPISLTKYVPSEHDQTGVDDWLRENTKVVQSEREQQEIDRQSESLWSFETLTTGRKNYRKK